MSESWKLVATITQDVRACCPVCDEGDVVDDTAGLLALMVRHLHPERATIAAPDEQPDDGGFLPQVTEVQRYRYEPGDKIVATVGDEGLVKSHALMVREHVHAILRVPMEDVLVVPATISLEVVSPGDGGASNGTSDT